MGWCQTPCSKPPCLPTAPSVRSTLTGHSNNCPPVLRFQSSRGPIGSRSSLATTYAPWCGTESDSPATVPVSRQRSQRSLTGKHRNRLIVRVPRTATCLTSRASRCLPPAPPPTRPRHNRTPDQPHPHYHPKGRLVLREIDRLVTIALNEDAPWGDLTSEVLIP